MAKVQKLRIKEGDTANQLMKAIAVAVSNLVQWFTLHFPRSLMSTVIPADADAAANVRVDVICNNGRLKKKHSLNNHYAYSN